MEMLRCTYIMYCGLIVKWRSCFGNSFLVPYKPKHRYHMTQVRIHKQTNVVGPTGWLSGYRGSLHKPNNLSSIPEAQGKKFT